MRPQRPRESVVRTGCCRQGGGTAEDVCVHAAQLSRVFCWAPSVGGLAGAQTHCAILCSARKSGGGLNSVDGGLVRFVSEEDVSSAWRTGAAQVAAVLSSCRSGCCRPTSLLRPPAESSPTGRSSRGGPRLARYLPAFRTSSCRLWLGDSLETAPPAGSPSPSARRRWRWTRCAATRW